jgi:hypothetical protein
MHHFDPWMTILNFLLVKGLHAAWNYGKQLVQAVALYCLAVRFVAFFVASYVSQPGARVPGNEWC